MTMEEPPVWNFPLHMFGKKTNVRRLLFLFITFT